MTADEQSGAVLATKLGYAQRRARVAARSRLLDRLTTVVPHHALTLIAAPAGFGKTTLVGSWALACGLRYAWLSLDDDDNDDFRFLHYLHVALYQAAPEIGKHPLDRLHAARFALNEATIRALLTDLLNELVRLSERLVLILDDYDAIISARVHSSLSFLLDRLPENVNVIMTCRSVPPLQIARLRARAQLAELTSADLRFTAEEAARFYNQVMGLNLPADSISAVEARTEGWIAGMQLVALSTRVDCDPVEFAQGVNGMHRHIVDYLAEEVVSRLSDEVYQFLLQTSILTQLTAPLCTAVTGNVNSQSMLERLEQANLFTFALDDQRRWYRYHRLMVDFLRHRLSKEYGDQARQLHLRAANWFKINGMPEQAIEHLLDAADYSHAALLLEHETQRHFDRYSFGRLLKWLDRLPDAVLKEHPALALMQAAAILLSGQTSRFEMVEARVQEAQQALAGAGQMSDVLSALLALLRGDSARSIRLGHEQLNRDSTEQRELRGLLALQLGEAYRLRGDPATTIRAFEQALAINRDQDRPFETMIAAYQLANARRLVGQLRAAFEDYQTARRIFETQPVDKREGWSSLAVLTYCGMAVIYAEWYDLDAAHHFAQKARELADSLGDPLPLLVSLMAQGDVQLAARDYAAADQTLGRLTVLVDARAVSTQVTANIAACRAYVWLALGQPDRARAWARDTGLLLQTPADANRATEFLTLAWLLFQTDMRDNALEVVDGVIAAAEYRDRPGDLLDALLLRALIQQAQGDVEAAITGVQRALHLAQTEGWLARFVAAGADLISLLRHALKREPEHGLARRVLETLLQQFPPTGSVPLNQALPDPLSERELTIMRLISAGLSNPEIATQLVVSTETVKWHVKNVFRKLSVDNRAQAVARARSLGLSD